MKAANLLPKALTKLSPKWLVIIMFLMTALPLSVAWVMVLNDWKPSKITANGDFFTPPIDWQEMTRATFVGEENTWRLFVVESECDSGCERRLESYRKMHVALGRQSDNLSRVLVTSQPFESSDRFLYQINDSSLVAEVQPLEHKVWLADPDGWIVMGFDAEQSAAELHKDILKLLKSNPRS